MTIDKENMKEIISKSPKQFAKGLDLAKDIKIEGNFKNVIVCGMGGSALPVNIINSVFSPSVPIYAHRDYNLPKVANKDSLVICVSYSGNTEETVSAMEESFKKGFKTIAMATGGKIEEVSKQNNIPLAKIPAGIQPRSATGYLFSALSVILANCGIINNPSEEIFQLAEALEKINFELEKQGKSLAKKLAKEIPVIYASNNFKAAARIWKIKFNENSKIPAFHNYFPELNHNEMVGFTNIKKTSPLHVLIIRDSNDNPKIIKRMELTASIIKKKGVRVDFIDTKEGSLMFKMFSCLLLGDWTSYHLAINQKINPTPVAIVEDFKKLMQK
jgi:glucose/mannose-6-phosphate isomerase